jgi:predicted tellurium resistance membrane protein TerC
MLLVVVLLTHDDVVLVAFAVADVDPAIRSRIILIGIASAVVLRVVLASGAILYAGKLSDLISQSLSVTPVDGLSLLLGTSVIGMTLTVGILRLWRTWKVYRTITQERALQYTTSFWWPTIAVVFSEFAASIEAVVFTAGVSRGIWWLFAAGLALSVALKAFASEMIAALFRRYPWITWVGLLIVLWVAVNLIYDGTHEVVCEAFGVGCSQDFWGAILDRLGLGPGPSAPAY